MSQRRTAAGLLPVVLLGGCFLASTPFPPKLAVQQLEAAKKLQPQSAEYDGLATLPVACPAAPATDRQRDMACAQLWTYKASSCLKRYQDQSRALAGRVVISAEERTAPAAALNCALAASGSALAFLPLSPSGSTDTAALSILIVRARAVELRRERRDTRDTVVDDAEIGAVAAQMTPLPGGALPDDGSPPDGAYYASYFLAGTAARNAAKAALAARSGPEAQRPAEKAKACALAQGGLQVLPRTTPVRALDAPVTTRRNILTRVTTEFCG